MANWIYNPQQYVSKNFELIPEGDYRVTINKVVSKTFSSGNEGFEITLDVPGYDSKLWYYLILDPLDVAKTNNRIGMFFDSFNIKDYDLANYSNWNGLDGAVRVRHTTYNGRISASVAFCLSRVQHSRIPIREEFNTNSRTTTNGLRARKDIDFDGFSF